MTQKHTLEDIKRGIERHLGKDIIVRANKGRKKVVMREGILECAYSNIFIVTYPSNNNRRTRVSYSYADVLTSTVQLTLIRNNENSDEKYA